MSVVILALAVLSLSRVDLRVRPFRSSAGDGILELRGIVRSVNRARSMSSLVSLHFRIVFLTVWTWRSTNPWPRG